MNEEPQKKASDWNASAFCAVFNKHNKELCIEVLIFINHVMNYPSDEKLHRLDLNNERERFKSVA